VTRLYYTAPWQRAFDATVLAVEGGEAGQRVYLDRTAFYPTSGGQPHDTGTLGGVRVVEVIDEADPDREDAGTGGAGEAPPRVAHVVNGPLAVGERVSGLIDWPRRFDHMQQHTGQHVLSAALHRLHDVRTVSFHLGAETATIDLAREVAEAELTAAVAEANRIVWEDRPVTIRFVSNAEASRLPLRKQPAKSGRLRLIDVEDFDLSACGGTHVSRTGAIGVIAVRARERFKGGTRLTFVCGGRALRAFEDARDIVDATAGPLTVHPHDLPAAVARVIEERRILQREVRALAGRLAGHEGERLVSRAEVIAGCRTVLAALEGIDAADLKTVAAAALRAGAHAVVLVTTEPPLQVVAARAADGAARMDAGALVRTIAVRFGGKGGGRPDLAQGGGLGATPEEVLSASRSLLDDAAGPD
jgi:alanyl-tRNA synthetase